MKIESEIKVAIVEDTEDILMALSLLIDGNEGFICKYTFNNCEDAIQNLPGKDVNIVLMDINLPGMNGIECVSKLKPLMPSTQFMMCTVYEDDDNIFKALKAGATGYILKKTEPNKILESLRELFTGGAPMSGEIARKVVAAFNQPQSFSLNQLEILTVREKEILAQLAKGFLYKEIADSLFISKETVKKHIHNIYKKLEVQTRTEALNKAFAR